MRRPSSSVSPGDRHCLATAWWALSCCFLSHIPGYKCPAKKFPQEKQAAGHRGFLFVSFSSEERVCSKGALSQGPPSSLGCTLWDSSRVHHMSPQPFQLLAEWNHFMSSEILAMHLCLLSTTYTRSCEEYPSRYVVPRDPIYPYISMAFPVLRRGLLHKSCRLWSCLDTWVGNSPFSSSTFSPDVQLSSPADPKLFLLGY